MWIDTHCHLESFHRRKEVPEVIERARQVGVEGIITIGTSLADWELYQQLATKHPGYIWHTVGLHPSDVGEDWQEQLQALPTFFTLDPLPVALGEIGLDHFRLPKYPDEAAEVKARQENVFRRQLELAAQLDVPVVVHSRAAFDACVRVIDDVGFPWARVVFHCFADGPEKMEILNQRGGRGSFTGILTYPKAPEVRGALLEQGVERLMLETDAPYLAPVPHRGKPNEPAYVAHTALAAAELLRLDPDDLAAKTSATARAFFGLEG